VSKIFKIVRDVGPDDWSALPREFKAGETVYKYSGHDYGLARDDFLICKRSVISCSLDGGIPFFTVPVEFLTDEHGRHPTGPYG
jgi:hypothetical protein